MSLPSLFHIVIVEANSQPTRDQLSLVLGLHFFHSINGINVGVSALQSMCSNETDEILLLESLADDLKQKVIVGAVTHTAKGSLSPGLLARTWHIGLEIAMIKCN